MTSAAQEEFNNIINNSNSFPKTHPEDSLDSSSDHDGTTLHSGNEDGHSPSPRKASPVMPTATYIPTNTQFDANTGPKGVIADARSFETAKKRTFRQTLYAFANGESPPIFGNKSKFTRENSKSQSPSPSPDISDNEDEFMQTWRANRLEQLATMSSETRTRRLSPSKRTYGSLVTVDPAGYLDAVEKVPMDTIVVVLIYDDEVSLLSTRLKMFVVLTMAYCSLLSVVKLRMLLRTSLRNTLPSVS